MKWTFLFFLISAPLAMAQAPGPIPPLTNMPVATIFSDNEPIAEFVERFNRGCRAKERPMNFLEVTSLLHLATTDKSEGKCDEEGRPLVVKCIQDSRKMMDLVRLFSHHPRIGTYLELKYGMKDRETLQTIDLYKKISDSKK